MGFELLSNQERIRRIAALDKTAHVYIEYEDLVPDSIAEVVVEVDGAMSSFVGDPFRAFMEAGGAGQHGSVTYSLMVGSFVDDYRPVQEQAALRMSLFRFLTTRVNTD